jgi:translation initiation factor eIF-2B subunit epsilon
VAVGNETVIGNDSRIVDSVIGKNCVIGDNCVIEGSYIWDNCVIEDGCNVGGSIIAEDCTVLTGVTIEEGCILGYGVFVGPACVLPRYTKLTTRAKILEYDGEIPDADPEIVGHEANCVVWHDEYDMDEDADEQDERNLLVSSLARDLDESLTLHDEDSESEAGDEEEYGEEAVFDPHVEIRLTLERSIEDEHTFENAALELNTLKMALNIRFHDIRQVIFPVLFRKIFEADGNIPVNAKAVFTRWTGLIAKFVHNTEDQRDCLDIMEEYCTGNEALEGCFMGVLKIMYEEDMLEEDTIFEWHHQTRGSSIGVRVQPLVSWLENASAESSEEGSGSE